MASGIYELNFNNQYYYVGKSIDVENRWRQHFGKFEKRTAAKNMLNAFDRFGYPKTRILIECHQDHLDILEPIFIKKCKDEHGSYCLNASMPEIYRWPSDKHLELIEDDIGEVFKKSTFDHIDEIDSLANEIVKKNYIIDKNSAKISSLTNKVNTLTKEITEYPFKIDLGEEGNAWRQRYLEAEQQIALNQSKISNLKQQLHVEKNKSWWKKLWE